ncbi:hypothetical protein LV779_02790 [Streptomyces thinghirensis]|nr:hypothetical protein [Streptomyces thinghirensis]
MSPYSQQAPRRRARLRPGVALLLVAETALVAGACCLPARHLLRRPDDRRTVQPSKDEILVGHRVAAAHARARRAITQAKRTGKKVVVTDETMATTYTVANPDGTLTLPNSPPVPSGWRDG